MADIGLEHQLNSRLKETFWRSNVDDRGED
uniref:Uncharacterized protein n=1 Tax=Tetranychus urticae TaxID=32264 RepID=T1JZD1_TETUR